MYELAFIILSIPPKQSTVDRSFSIMEYIYSSRRERLSPKMLENILIVNLNGEFLDSINERDLNNL